MTRRTITIERTFNAPIEDVWTLWTTADGIESWWGPEGFRVAVRKLELRAGGALHYDMIAVAPDQIAYMKKAGMPVSSPTPGVDRRGDARRAVDEHGGHGLAERARQARAGAGQPEETSLNEGGTP
jgi:hypothetical protein